MKNCLRTAVDARMIAIEGHPVLSLVDGVVMSKFWWIPYVYGQQSYIVEGTPLIDPQLASAWEGSEHLVTYIETDGTLRKTVSMSSGEYYELRESLIAD